MPSDAASAADVAADVATFSSRPAGIIIINETCAYAS